MDISVALNRRNVRNLRLNAGDETVLNVRVYRVDGDVVPIAPQLVTNPRIVTSPAGALSAPVGSMFTAPYENRRLRYKLTAEISGVTTTLCTGVLIAEGALLVSGPPAPTPAPPAPSPPAPSPPSPSPPAPTPPAPSPPAPSPPAPSPPALGISGTPVLTGTQGVPYAGFTVTASGGTPPYSFSIVAGVLPAGIALNSASTTATVSGTPTAASGSRITVRKTATSGTPATADSNPFSIFIGPPGGSPPPPPPAPSPSPAPSPAPAPSPPTGTAPGPIVFAGANGTKPFAVGQVFQPGAVPAGQDIALSGSSVNGQATVLSTWPDGSVRHALLAGAITLASGNASLSAAAGTASTGTALTTADLQSALTDEVSITAGAFGSASWSGSDWAAPFKTTASGHRMSSWVYRKPVGSNVQLVAWLEVRLFAGGAVEILPWVENCYLYGNGSAGTNKSATYTFSMGGTQRFSAAIDLPYFARTPLVSGTALSHWLGTDPGLVPTHDKAYLQSTRMVPSYRAVVPADAAAIAALPATFTPLQLGGYRTGMADPGHHGSIGLLPEWDVLYLTSDATTTWAALQRNAYSAGRIGMHFRDEATNRPIRFSQKPHLSSNYSYTGDIPVSFTGTSAAAYGMTHVPSMGCMAYVLTARFFHLETLQFSATANYIVQVDNAADAASNPGRNGSEGIFLSESGAATVRGVAWATRTLAQAAAITPDDDVLKAEFVASLTANINFNHARYVAQPNHPFGFVHPYGDTYGTPTDGKITDASWQQDFYTAAYGYMLSMQPPVSGGVTIKLREFFHWKARSVVGRLGGTGANEWLFRDAGLYNICTALVDDADWRSGVGPWPSSWGAMYDAYFSVSPPGTRDAAGALRGGNFPGAYSYWGNLMPAIAYAVEHGVSGAASGLARLTSAPNWADYLADEIAYPEWAVATPAKAWPAWRTSMAAWEWKELTSAAFTDVGYAGLIDAYCGLAAIDADVCGAGLGGHGDGWDNGLRKLNLRHETPTWSLVHPGSSDGAQVPNVRYYLDGRPTSAHTYWHLQGDETRKLLFRFSGGATYGSGMYSSTATDACDIETGQWAAEGTWQDTLGGGTGQCMAKDFSTGDVHSLAGWWNHATGEWTAITPNIEISGYYRGSVVDSIRQRYVVFSNDYGPSNTCIARAKSTGLWTRLVVPDGGAITAQDLCNAGTPGVFHHLGLDRYHVKFGGGGTLYEVHPDTLAISIRATTGGTPPDAYNGQVFGRFINIPSLGVYGYQPRGNSKFWVLATE